MNHWWRAYNNAVDNEKLIFLSDSTHRAWFNLMCLASDNDGVLPEMKVLSLKLRQPPQHLAKALTELVDAKLFVKREDGRFAPHNWQKRQYKTDKLDPTNAKRQQAWRDRQKARRNAAEDTGERNDRNDRNGNSNGNRNVTSNGNRNGEHNGRNGDSNAKRQQAWRDRQKSIRSADIDNIEENSGSSGRYDGRNGDSNGALRNTNNACVTKHTETETDNRKKIDVAVDARARNGTRVEEPAIELSNELLLIVGHDPAFVPPGWCGAAMTVQSWLNQGWNPEIIRIAVKASMGRYRGDRPPQSVQFFRNAIAEEHARQAAPIPVVEIQPQQKLVINGSSHARPHSLVDSIKRDIAALTSSDGADSEMPTSPILQLPPRSIR